MTAKSSNTTGLTSPAQAARAETINRMAKFCLMLGTLPFIGLWLLGLYPGGTPEVSILGFTMIGVFLYMMYAEFSSCMDDEEIAIANFRGPQLDGI